MPTYEYVCSNCGQRMEVVHSIHGHGPDDCPKCGSPMKKAFSAPAVHFKGSGWARKDRSGGSKPSRSKEVEASTESTTSAASDAGSPKPETTA